MRSHNYFGKMGKPRSSTTLLTSIRTTDCIRPRVNLHADHFRLAAVMTRVIYNRISKAGSTTLTALILALSKINKFTVENDSEFFPTNTTLYNTLVTRPQDSIYINHCNYVENLPNDFVWINMIREPLERAESLFYYELSPKRRSTAVAHDLKVRIHDGVCGCPYDEFDSCYRKRAQLPQCTARLALQSKASMYFSEASEHTGLRDSSVLYEQMLPGWTAEQAFERIRIQYLFVGLTEEFELSVRALEQLLPRFFANATAVYHGLKQDAHANRTPDVNPKTNTTMGGAITTYVRELLTEHNAAEMNMYQKTKRLFWWKVAQILPNEINYGTQ